MIEGSTTRFASVLLFCVCSQAAQLNVLRQAGYPVHEAVEWGMGAAEYADHVQNAVHPLGHLQGWAHQAHVMYDYATDPVGTFVEHSFEGSRHAGNVGRHTGHAGHAGHACHACHVGNTAHMGGHAAHAGAYAGHAAAAHAGIAAHAGAGGGFAAAGVGAAGIVAAPLAALAGTGLGYCAGTMYENWRDQQRLKAAYDPFLPGDMFDQYQERQRLQGTGVDVDAIDGLGAAARFEAKNFPNRYYDCSDASYHQGRLHPGLRRYQEAGTSAPSGRRISAAEYRRLSHCFDDRDDKPYNYNSLENQMKRQGYTRTR